MWRAISFESICTMRTSKARAVRQGVRGARPRTRRTSTRAAHSVALPLAIAKKRARSRWETRPAPSAVLSAMEAARDRADRADPRGREWERDRAPGRGIPAQPGSSAAGRSPARGWKRHRQVRGKPGWEGCASRSSKPPRAAARSSRPSRLRAARLPPGRGEPFACARGPGSLRSPCQRVQVEIALARRALRDRVSCASCSCHERFARFTNARPTARSFGRSRRMDALRMTARV